MKMLMPYQGDHALEISKHCADSKNEPKSTSSLKKQTCDLSINKHAVASIISLANTRSEPKKPSLPELNPYRVRVTFSKPVHVARVRIGPLGANHGLFTTKPSSCHVHSTLWVTTPPSPCPTLFADVEPVRKHTETIFSALRNIIKSTLNYIPEPIKHNKLLFSAIVLNFAWG